MKGIGKVGFSLLIAGLPIFLGVAHRGTGQTVAERPNVLLIVVDDMGYSDTGAYGGEIRTPNVDGLARSGVRQRAPTRCEDRPATSHRRGG